MRLSRVPSPRDAALLAEAWLTLLFVDLGLRRHGLRRMMAWAAAAPAPRPPLPDAEARQRIARVQRWVRAAASHHLWPVACLRRALAAQRLLARRGLATDLRIGVRRDEGTLVAHAWLEYAGQPLGEAEALEDHFAVLTALGGREP